MEKKMISPTEEVAVCSNFKGRLHYESARTGVNITWEDIGAIQYMTINELVDMRSSQRAFFSENWIYINDERAEDIYKQLRIEEYYKSAFDAVDFIKNINKKTPKTIEEQLSNASKGMKTTIAELAREKYIKGEIDSIKALRSLEKVLGVEIMDN